MEKRTTYRRYEDRRVAMMLAIHEILFAEPPSQRRDELILNEILNNYRVDRAAILEVNPLEKHAVIAVRVGDWQTEQASPSVQGPGFEELLNLHERCEGALTFESVRKPDMFNATLWDDLWKNGLAAPAKALLSVTLSPSSQPTRMLWLQQFQSSREWSSRDRDLLEEIAYLLTRALEKGV